MLKSNVTIYWQAGSWLCVVYCFILPPQIKQRKGLELSPNGKLAFSGLVELSIWGPKRCRYKWPPLRSKNKAHPWNSKSIRSDQNNNLVHPPPKNKIIDKLSNINRPGRPQTTKMDNHRILSMMKKNLFLTASPVQSSQEHSRGGLSSLKSTIKRRLHEHKYRRFTRCESLVTLKNKKTGVELP